MAGRGGRGGGRGGGPGRGGAMGGPLGSATAFLDYAKVDKTPSKMFPETGRIPRLDPPTEEEKTYVAAQIHYLSEQKHSPYWPVEIEKKVKDLPRYSDRYRQEEQEQPSLQKDMMQQEVFPQALWKSFFEGEEKRAAAKAKRKDKLKMTKEDWERLEKTGEVEDPDGVDAEDEVQEEEVGDYDEEEEDDYNENYFDNGEDDDIEDLGGGGGGGEDYD